MSSYKDHGFYTHQPYLGEVIKNTTGNILECGCGDGSTHMIREFIKGTDRKLVSLESDNNWLSKYTHLADNNHKLYHVNAGNADTVETGNQWVECIQNLPEQLEYDVVFLDSTPWMSRKCCFDYFLDKAKLIVIHDFDYFPNNNIIGITTHKEVVNGKEKIECDMWGIVNHWKLFYPPYKYFVGLTGPPTLVCSNTMESKEFDELIKGISEKEAGYWA